jgi:outer membrane receptor protein involved in Fe transport
MIAAGIPSITVGVSAMGNMLPGQVTMKNYEKAVAQNFIYNNRQLMRGVFTLDGAVNLFGEDWTWEAYAQHSGVRERQFAPYNTYDRNYSNAIDAVLVQASGPNSLGGGNAATATAVHNALTAAGAHVPAVGEIACRSALTQTSWGTTTNQFGYSVIQPGGLMAGCEPLNLFGSQNASQAALNYVGAGRTNRAIQDQALYRINQAVMSLSASGTVPFGLPAGKIAVATGFEYRLEQMRVQRDPLQLGATGVFESGNFAQYAGQYNVEEGFLELSIPILKNQFVDSLDFDAAGRITSYSTSGMVQTWKLGATSQVNEDIKLRASYSNDIRAPSVGELFASPLISTQTVTYPPGTGQSFNVKFASPGNPTLVPEQSFTVSGGVVLTPHQIENLSLSFDWYSISIHKGIFAFNNNQIFDQCANQHVASFCSLVFFAKGFSAQGIPVAAEVDGNGVSPGLSAGLGTFSADREGALNFYLRSPLNATSESVSGLDFQVDYHHDLLDGVMSYHMVGNYTDQKTRTALGQTFDGAGAVSGDSSVNPLAGFTMPKLRATVATTYTEDLWSVTAQARVLGSARLSNQYLEGTATTPIPTGYIAYVDNNSVPAVIYADLRASWRWNDHIQLYGAVDNALNSPPPIIASTGGGGTDCRIYDCIGRSYRFGVRFND